MIEDSDEGLAGIYWPPRPHSQRGVGTTAKKPTVFREEIKDLGILQMIDFEFRRAWWKFSKVGRRERGAR